MDKKPFGIKDGKKVCLYELKNEKLSVTLSTLGARVVSIRVGGRDVTGGFDTLDGYISDDSYQGATVGRVANRIDGCSFIMDGKEYSLPNNNGGATLHGGKGFSKRVWEVLSYDCENIVFSYTSPDGEDDFPAELYTEVRFSLTESGLMIDYTAKPRGKTPISLTNHTYFNLDGLGGTVENHKAVIYADRYTEVNDRLIPTGVRPDVDGTLFDFKESREFKEGLEKMRGYDHNFILSPIDFKSFGNYRLGLAAEFFGKDLGMKVYTDRPAAQLYTGNFLGSGPDFKGGIKQVRHGAFCFETQTEPNGVRCGRDFYSNGEIYKHTTVYEFFAINQRK